MEPFERILRKALIVPYLTQALAIDQRIYLVGGAVRDHLEQRAITDFDFASSFDPTEVARSFARKIKASWFWLDEQRRQSRVLRRTRAGEISYDFAPYRGSDLMADLALRDFTVNAIAVELSAEPIGTDLIDPMGGEKDLAAKRLRLCSSNVLNQDPVRALRALRYSLTHHYAVDEHVRYAIDDVRARIKEMPSERTGAELIASAAVQPFSAFLMQLSYLGLRSVAFGGHRADNDEALFKQLQQAEQRLEILCQGEQGRAVRQVLDRQWQQGLSTRTLLLLGLVAALDRKQVDFDDVTRAWCLSKRARALMKSLLNSDRIRWTVTEACAHSPRALAIAFESLSPFPEEKFLWTQVQQPAEPMVQALGLEALARWPEMSSHGRVPDMVDGKWIRRQTGLPPGPEIGRMLATIKQGELMGKFADLEGLKTWLERKKR